MGFRYTVRQIATGYDVTGAVRNLPDGRVELIARGESDEVEAFLGEIRTSAVGGHITKEEKEAVSPVESFSGFRILPS